jgi:GNAT superfamily N-acetyltransferase
MSKQKNNCDCAQRFDVRLARATEYPAWKKVLNVGRHPAFIGKSTMTRNANNGGALFYELDGQVVAVSLINPHYGILLTLNVCPEHRSHGLGAAILQFLMPNFARVVENKIEWFERRGYKRIGSLKRGISLNTQLMARNALFDLAGNLRRAWGLPSNEKLSDRRGAGSLERFVGASGQNRSKSQ